MVRGFPRGGSLVGYVDPQRSLYACDNQYLEFVGEDTFYGFLAQRRPALFRDEDFASLHTQNDDRTSVPPSILAKALLLQTYDRVSDEEAAERALFERSIAVAKGSGLLKSRKIRVELDTTPIFGKGAAKDTYNLLADGIRQLVRVLARMVRQGPAAWAKAHDLSRYYGSSLKGEAAIDRDDAAARQALLDGIVADAERLLAEARRMGAGYAAESASDCELVVKVPRDGKPGYCAKGDVKIDLEHDCVTCPAGQTTSQSHPHGVNPRTNTPDTQFPAGLLDTRTSRRRRD
jgi:hypothetical protein